MKLEKYQDVLQDLKLWWKYYIAEKKAQNASKNTLKAYERVFNELYEFCHLEKQEQGVLSIKDLNKYFIHNYINYLKEEREMASSTVTLHLNVIKAFFRFISENNEDAIDMLQKIEKVKIKNKIQKKPTYTEEELKKIRNHVKGILEESKNYYKVKNALIIYFISVLGMRADEVLSLKLDSFQEQGEIYEIYVKGKGDKQRILPVRKEIIEKYLKKYLMLRKQKVNKDNEYLFPAFKDKQSYFSLYKYNKSLMLKLLISPKKAGLHTYRHTFAKLMVENNVNMETLRELLGHSDISTTSKYYARTSMESKRKAIEIIV